MRRLMWFSIGFGAACALGAYCFPQNILLIGILTLAAGITFAVCTRWVKVFRFAAVVVLAFSLGVGWFAVYDARFLTDARQMDGEICTADIEVTDYCAETEFGYTVSGRVTLEKRTYDVIVSDRESIACEPGDILHGAFLFRFTAHGGSKDPTYHRSEGVFLLAYPAGEISLQRSDAASLKFFAQHLRMKIIRRIESVFPADGAAFAKALLLGDRSWIDYETSTAFKVSGISHIVAVSGLHVSILFGIATLFFGRRRILLFLTGIPVLLLFASVTGFTPSVVRACIMQALMLTAMLVNREYDPPTALAAAALIMLIWNPMVVISISFQLSFGCIIGIFLFFDGIYGWLTDGKRLGSCKGKGIIPVLKRWFAASVSVSLSASVFTTPLVAIYFGTVSLVSLVTNLLVVWIIAYIFCAVLLTCGISLLSMSAGRVAGWIITYPIRFVVGTSKLIASFPLSAVYTESIYIVLWLVICYGMLAVFLCLKKKPVFLYSALCTVSLCICLLLSWWEPVLDDCRLTVLDVGQGQSLLLQSDGKTFLIDCGGSSDRTSADKAAQTLLSQGICRLDGVIVTHYDSDHAGGIVNLLTRISADALYLPELADEQGIGQSIRRAYDGNIVTVSEDLMLSFGNTEISIFGPESYDLSNECSLCVLFQRENCDILITGDRGSLGEMLLLHRTELPQVDVLIAGHHGSAGSTGEKLLAQTMPKYVFVSVGRNNRYGHPSEKLLDRLAQYGCLVLRTDWNGTIIYRG